MEQEIWKEAYLSALMELGAELSGEDLKPKFAAHEIEEECKQLKAKILETTAFSHLSMHKRPLSEPHAICNPSEPLYDQVSPWNVNHFLTTKQEVVVPKDSAEDLECTHSQGHSATV